jgi:hypothetical protein
MRNTIYPSSDLKALIQNNHPYTASHHTVITHHSSRLWYRSPCDVCGSGRLGLQVMPWQFDVTHCVTKRVLSIMSFRFRDECGICHKCVKYHFLYAPRNNVCHFEHFNWYFMFMDDIRTHTLIHTDINTHTSIHKINCLSFCVPNTCFFVSSKS